MKTVRFTAMAWVTAEHYDGDVKVGETFFGDYPVTVAGPMTGLNDLILGMYDAKRNGADVEDLRELVVEVEKLIKEFVSGKVTE